MVDEALSEIRMRDYSSIDDLAKTIEKRRKEREKEKTNNPSTLMESSSKQNTKQNKSKKSKPSSSRQSLTKRDYPSFELCNIVCMSAEMKEINGNIIQSTLSDSFSSKNFWQNLAKFCPNLVNSDVPTNINLAPGSIHVHYDSYSDRFIYNLITKKNFER